MTPLTTRHASVIRWSWTLLYRGSFMPRSQDASRPFTLLRVVLLAAIAAAAACSSQDHSRGMSWWTSGATSWVQLTRNAHPLAQPDADLGRLDAAMPLHNLSLVFALSPAQRADRDALLDDVQRPGSPRYHQFLTPEEYSQRFGARPDDVAQASAWLASQGFSVHAPSRLGARVTFSGTVGQVESAFRTEMHRYAAFGETHYAMASAPSVPAELADHVLALYNAHDFHSRHGQPQLRVAKPAATCPTGAFCSDNGIAPPDWSVIYDIGSLYNPGISGTKITGTGVTIAVVGISDIAQADLTAFRTRYGLATNAITKTLVPNTGTAVGDNGAGIEAVLDTEWSG
ncbi:MAG TPA: protease pro-enzyme activation domain-containing protein, partial [Polyangia bacterium]